MAKKDDKQLLYKKVKYYISEFVVLLVTLMAVILSDALEKRGAGTIATMNDIHLDAINILISGIIALMVYGLAFTKMKYSEDIKPPLIKRLLTALMNGVAWRTFIGWIK